MSEWLMYPCGVAAVIMISLSKNEFKPGLSDKGMEESPIDSANLPAVTSEPGKARTAGILTIIAGVLGILNLGMCCIYITLLTLLSKSGGIFQNVYSTEYLNFQYFFYFAWGIVSVIFGILALIGGIMALRKKHWKWALTGSIAGIMAFWPPGIARPDSDRDLAMTSEVNKLLNPVVFADNNTRAAAEAGAPCLGLDLLQPVELADIFKPLIDKLPGTGTVRPDFAAVFT